MDGWVVGKTQTHPVNGMHRAVGEYGIPGQDACAAQGHSALVVD